VARIHRQIAWKMVTQTCVKRTADTTHFELAGAVERVM
jgi:hypothetical protein